MAEAASVSAAGGGGVRRRGRALCHPGLQPSQKCKKRTLRKVVKKKKNHENEIHVVFFYTTVVPARVMLIYMRVSVAKL